MASVSVALTMALTGCGSESQLNENSVSGTDFTTLSSAIVTKAVETDQLIVNIDQEAITTTSIPVDINFTGLDTINGLYLYVAALDAGTSQAEFEDINLSDLDFIDIIMAEPGETNASILVEGLERNSTYGFMPVSYIYDDANLSSSLKFGTGKVAATYNLLPELTAESKCMQNPDTCTWDMGAYVSWTLPEELTTVNLYRQTIEDGTPLEETPELVIGDYAGCNYYRDFNVELNTTYKYTLEAFNPETNATADKNVTVEVTIQ